MVINRCLYQCLYKRLLNLRQGLHNIPVPAGNQSTETTIEQVLTRANRRYQFSLIFGGAAIAACVLGQFLVYYQVTHPECSKWHKHDNHRIDTRSYTASGCRFTFNGCFKQPSH